MRAWYDIAGLDLDSPEDEDGIRESATAVQALVERETSRGLAAERVVLAGFSQGGAVALHAGLRAPRRLGGVIALSTYLPLASKLGEAHPANAAVPVFMAHGIWDNVLPQTIGARSRDVLREHGYDVEWHEYPVAHGVCAEEVGDVRAWLRRVLAL
jgi:phospholipase/carboxylesterase